jgi:hypothetical protein
MHTRFVFHLILLFSIALILSGTKPTRADMYGDILKRNQIEPTQEGLAKYLDDYAPSKKLQKEVTDLIEQLGADNFDDRETAEAELTKRATAARAALIKATTSTDPEVKWRSKRVLKNADINAEQLLLATFKFITRQEFKGLASKLLPTFPHIATQEQRKAAINAIKATATDDDLEHLSKALKSKDITVRAAAVAGLGNGVGKPAIAILKTALKDDAESVQLQAALALGDLGDRAALSALVKLLTSSKINTRLQAVRALRWLSKQKFNYVANFSEKDNAKPIDQWKQWVEKQGQSANLNFPIQVSSTIVLFNGEDLSGWQAVNNGQQVSPKNTWTVKEGILKCNGNGSGYLRSKRAFVSYELSVEWRWPKNKGGDSGVWLLMDGVDKQRPKALEAQLLQGKAGDFWIVGGLTVNVDGKRASGYASKKAPSNEKPLGQWNRMTARVEHGQVTIKINGLLQNKATDCPKGPSKLALQVEGDAIDFRNIIIQPLDQ